MHTWWRVNLSDWCWVSSAPWEYFHRYAHVAKLTKISATWRSTRSMQTQSWRLSCPCIPDTLRTLKPSRGVCRCVSGKKNFSAEIIEIFWDSMSHSKFFMAEIEDKQSLKMSISAAFQTTFNRFPCPHAHPALTSTAAKLLLVAKDRLSRNSFENSQTPYYSRAPTPTPIDPKHANCPLFSSLSIVAWLQGDLVVRFPTPLPPGSDILIQSVGEPDYDLVAQCSAHCTVTSLRTKSLEWNVLCCSLNPFSTFTWASKNSPGFDIFPFSKRPIFFILVGSYDLDIIDIVISPPHLRLDLLQLRLQRLTIAVRKRVQALRRVRRGRLEHHNQWNMMEHYSQSLGTWWNTKINGWNMMEHQEG